MHSSIVTGVLIDIDGTVSEVEIAAHNGHTLDAMQSTLRAHTVDCVTVGSLNGDGGAHELDAWIDDEGRYTSVPNHLAQALNMVAADTEVPEVFGPVLYLGHDGNGETVGLPSELAALLTDSAKILARRETICAQIIRTLDEQDKIAARRV